MLPIIAVIGASGSGKTTLIEYLIFHLSKEGLRIGTIKHVHHPGFTIDVKGKDTWKHSQAGAKIVVCAAPNEIAIIKKRDSSSKYEMERIINLVKDEELDLLIIEGFHSLIAKRQDIFKIITTNDEEDLRQKLTDTEDPILAIAGLITKQKTAALGIEIPLIDIDSDGEEILKLVKGIL
ncbi:molybdopterin-guanine dinucleotide biosynthesis protein B [Candidatus Bathyarchaeota archaeon]|nr:molybdopterin-guanine dinucleotide biosynthesis protein B [Candidatus Bathyarchaeota archaeon]